MHPHLRLPMMHIVINSELQSLSFDMKFFVSKCFHMTILKCVCLSLPEKRNHPSFINISHTLIIYTSMERSSRVLQHVAKPI